MSSFEEKIQEAKNLFSFYKGEFELFKSIQKHFRVRVELGFYHSDDKLYYAMFEGKKKVIVEELNFADEKITKLMPYLLKELQANVLLKEKLFGVEFLTSKTDLSVTLLYHKNIEDIKNELENLSLKLNLKLIARSKNKKLVFKTETLRQNLSIDNKQVLYDFSNDCFVQPNTYINEKMINWCIKHIKLHNKKDLLELYCGYGNFSIALACYFQNTLATELSKTNIKFAKENALLNKISNIKFVRMSSLDFSLAFNRVRKFNRLKDINLDAYKFSHILVDPPRLGLSTSIELVTKFENIIYISCNPSSLKQDLETLLKSHEIVNFAFFDQFVGTKHLECGVILKKLIRNST